MRTPSLRSFPSRVDIYRIAETWDADGGLDGGWPATPTITAREASVQLGAVDQGDAQGQVTTVFMGYAYFRVNDNLKKFDKIVWVDGAKTYVLIVMGDVNVVGRGQIFQVPIKERSIEA